MLAVQRLGALGQALGEVPVGAVAGELPDPAGGDVAELGPDEAGLDEHDVDAEPLDLLAEGVGVGLKGVLGGVVPGAQGKVISPPIEETLTIVPEPCRRRWGSTSWVRRAGPNRLTSSW